VLTENFVTNAQVINCTKMRKEVVVANFEVLFQNLIGRTDKPRTKGARKPPNYVTRALINEPTQATGFSQLSRGIHSAH
jgi:hypothetical protein